MYALFAFVTALAADLFVRAVDLRTTKAALVAAFAAVLLPAAHPYGLLVLAAEAVVALVVWRGRPLRPGLVVAAVGLLVLPYAIASLRLADRYGADLGADRAVVSPREAARYLEHALRSFAGGGGWLFFLFLALGMAGLILLARTRPAFVAFTGLAVAAPLVLLLVVGTEEGAADLHPPYDLRPAAWSAAIGAAVAAATSRLGRVTQAVPLRQVAALAVLAPAGGASDPRTAVSGEPDRARCPGGLDRRGGRRGRRPLSLLPVYLAALPTAKDTVVRPGRRPTSSSAGSTTPTFRSGRRSWRSRSTTSSCRERPEHPPAYSQGLPVLAPPAGRGPVRGSPRGAAGLADALTAAADSSDDRFRMAGQGLASVCNALATLGGSCPER